MNTSRQILCWIALLLCVARSGLADILYSTYGPDPYTPHSSVHTVRWNYTVFPDGGGTGIARAIATPFSFTGRSYELQSITLDIGEYGENTSNLQLGICYDAGGQPSSDPFISITPNPTFAGDERQSITYSFSSGSFLQPDTPYWLVLEPNTYGVSTDAYNAGYAVSSSRVQPYAGFSVRTLSYNGSGSWSDWTFYAGPPPVFQLDGIPVPEPSTWALLGLGSALLLGSRRGRLGK
jgi:hypothetical protein